MPVQEQRRDAACLRVLVVDDDPAVVDLAECYFERADGVETVLSETDPRAALERAVEDATIDCLVCDFDMPSMDGLELCRVVRSHRPDLPVVLFSGSANHAIEGRPDLSEVDAFVRKRGVSGCYDELVETTISEGT